MPTDLTDFLWNKFSEYYHENDNNKDQDPEAQNRGTLQRFLEVFGADITENEIAALENFIDELDPYTADDEFLTQIAWALGNPPDILGDTDVYRTILSQIISIYQIKGTKQSYELLFQLLGLSVTLEEFYPADNLYDDGLIYDDDTEDATTYDFSGCDVTCSDYTLTYDNLPGKATAPMTDDQVAALMDLITTLIQPVGAKLRSMDYVPVVVENKTFSIAPQFEPIAPLGRLSAFDDDLVFELVDLDTEEEVYNTDIATGGSPSLSPFNTYEYPSLVLGNNYELHILQEVKTLDPLTISFFLQRKLMVNGIDVTDPTKFVQDGSTGWKYEDNIDFECSDDFIMEFVDPEIIFTIEDKSTLPDAQIYYTHLNCLHTTPSSKQLNFDGSFGPAPKNTLFSWDFGAGMVPYSYSNNGGITKDADLQIEYEWPSPPGYGSLSDFPDFQSRQLFLNGVNITTLIPSISYTHASNQYLLNFVPMALTINYYGTYTFEIRDTP